MSGGLEISGASVAAGGKTILDSAGLVAQPGKLTGLIGPNGSGKSTLLRASLGIVPLQSGSVRFGDSDLLAMSRRDRAKLSAFVEQGAGSETHLTARDVVLLGRIPFQSVWQVAPSPEDDAVADAALAAVDMAPFADRLFHTLSGGEQQRLHIARALAQAPKLLLLDEPTNHLDIHAQLSVLALLQRRAQAGATILLALHDLNLAAAFCDALVVLQHGKVVARGMPEAVLTPALLHDVYGVDATILRHPATGRPLIAYGLQG